MKPRYCPNCGDKMTYNIYPSKSGMDWVNEYYCVHCKHREVAFASSLMMRDNEKIKELLDNIEDPKEGEVPWPEE